MIVVYGDGGRLHYGTDWPKRHGVCRGAWQIAREATASEINRGQRCLTCERMIHRESFDAAIAHALKASE